MSGAGAAVAESVYGASLPARIRHADFEGGGHVARGPGGHAARLAQEA